MNTRLGRWFFAIREKDVPFGTKVMEIAPNSLSYDYKVIGDRLQKTTAFRTDNCYQKRLEQVCSRAKALLPFSAMSIERLILPHPVFGFMPLVVLSTLTANPSAGDPGTLTVDGYPERSGVNETFSTIRGGAGTSATSTATYMTLLLESSATTNQFAILRRAHMGFDTSSIGSSATISAATLSVTSHDAGAGVTQTPFGAFNINCVGTTPASNTTLAASDYANFGTTKFATVGSGSVAAAGSYTDFSLNANGISNVSKTGVSNFGLRIEWDTDNNFTGTWVSNSDSAYYFRFADYGSTKPKLVVTYSTPTTYTQSLSETPAITEVNTNRKLTVWTALKSISDLPAIIDSIVRGTWNTSRSISDSPSINETVTRAWTAIKGGLSETITITETFSSLKIAIRTISETFGITETISRTWKNIQSFSDTVAITEIFSRIWTLANKTFSEQVQITEIFNGFRAAVRSMTDSLGITDTLTRGAWFNNQRPSESVTITETISRTWSFARTLLTEQISITDFFKEADVYVFALAESLGITEAFTVIDTYVRSLSENSAITDTFSKYKFRILNLSETLSIIENSVATSRVVIFFNRTVNDNVNIIEFFATPLNWVARTPVSATWIPRTHP